MSKTPDEILGEAKEAARLYVDAETDSLKLKLTRRLTRYLSATVKIAVLLVIGALALVFFSFAGAFALSEYLQDTALAFTYIGTAYVVLLLLVLILSNVLIKRPILKKLVSEMFSDK
ncbi:MAG: phage holin family protein [Cryomorphaceae bacterium]